MLRIYALTLGAALLAHAAVAQPAPDPDWPCVQRKVTHLSVGQVWAGPPVPEDPSAWREDEDLARLVERAAARRTSMEEVEDMLAEVSATDEQTREERLTALFAGAFHIIDRERARIIEGITRYARKQRALSEHIDQFTDEINEAKRAAGPEDFDALDRIEEMEDRLIWDTRIFDDRRRSLTHVCDSPRELEQRAFSLARLVQSELDER